MRRRTIILAPIGFETARLGRIFGRVLETVPSLDTPPGFARDRLDCIYPNDIVTGNAGASNKPTRQQNVGSHLGYGGCHS